MSATVGNTIDIMHESLEEAFPDVDPGALPLGARVLVQLRSPKRKTRGGLVLVEETRETEVYNTQIAKVIQVGALAFRNRATGEPWPEGTWVNEGDYVRVPRWGGDRWQVQVPGSEEPALFLLCNDHELMAKVTADPLSMRNYIL